jgi:glucose-1-phosphate adenylyltransferase
VAVSDAKRFGVIECNNSGFITGFEEKPLQPKTVPDRPDKAMVSMGIYVFKTSVLLDILSEETPHGGDRLDFGRDIFPSLIENYRVYAYEYDQAQTECYWQDIGTIDSFYDANMQLLQSYPAIDLNDTNWPIRTHVKTVFPARLCVDSKGNNGSVSDSIIASGCVLHGSIIRHSILFNSVHVDEKTIIENSLVLPGARVGKRCKVRNAIIDSDVVLADGSVIGHDREQDAMQYHVSRNGISVVSQQLKPKVEQKNHLGTETQCGTQKSIESKKTPPNRVARLL